MKLKLGWGFMHSFPPSFVPPLFPLNFISLITGPWIRNSCNLFVDGQSLKQQLVQELFHHLFLLFPLDGWFYTEIRFIVLSVVHHLVSFTYSHNCSLIFLFVHSTYLYSECTFLNRQYPPLTSTRTTCNSWSQGWDFLKLYNRSKVLVAEKGCYDYLV